jgi:hypothetical protein
MRHIQEDGSQFAFSRLRPNSLVGWQYFYTSNLSVKKGLIRDWMGEGFDTGFPGAALEDMELCYRLWQSPAGIRLYYDPASVGLHYHPYSLNRFMERQFFVGKSLRRMLELHPDLVDEYGTRAVDTALHNSERAVDESAAAAAIEEIKVMAYKLEAQEELGSQEWHGSFVSALFELCMIEGYASAWPEREGNADAARIAMFDRFSFRMRAVSGWPGVKSSRAIA